jgi:hypothetical protein
MVLQWDKPNSAGPSLARGAAQRRNRHWAIAMELKKTYVCWDITMAMILLIIMGLYHGFLLGYNMI